MATLYTHQDSNIYKTWALFGVFLAVVIGVGWLASFYFDSPAILYVAVAFSIFMNVFSYWFSDKIVLKMSGARPADEYIHRDLINIVENLAITAGLPRPKVFVINDSAPNAFATGRNKEHAVVAVTEGLMSILDRSELEGVIAHELAHIGNRDMLLSTVAVVLVGFVAILSDIAMRASFHGGGNRKEGGGVMIIVSLVLIILAPIMASLIQLAISRRREFLADATGALLTRYPEGLASALEKISRHSTPVKRASDATAHLYFSNPFGAGMKGVHKLFMTHPPIEERIKALRNKE